jgi:hypothetical protein
MMDDEKTAMLRHTLATVAYRGGKAVRGVPPEFPSFRACEGARTPAQILAHIGDLFDWALSLAEGKQRWHDSQPLPWDQETARFFAALGAFDRRLATAPPAAAAEKLFQGPIADALTHIGQIAMLRRLCGCQMKPENYFVASVTAGQVGPEQAPPVKEF